MPMIGKFKLDELLGKCFTQQMKLEAPFSFPMKLQPLRAMIHSEFTNGFTTLKVPANHYFVTYYFYDSFQSAYVSLHNSGRLCMLLSVLSNSPGSCQLFSSISEKLYTPRILLPHLLTLNLISELAVPLIPIPSQVVSPFT